MAAVGDRNQTADDVEDIMGEQTTVKLSMAEGMCEKHAAQWSAWSDYPLVAQLRINGGASYDDSVRGVQHRRAERVKEWKATIRYQQDLIRRICATHCTAQPSDPFAGIDENGEYIGPTRP